MKKFTLILLFLNCKILISSDFNFLFNLFDGIGVEYRTNDSVNIGFLIYQPQEPFIFKDYKSHILKYTYDLRPIGYREVSSTQYDNLDFRLYLDYFPFRDYNLFLTIFYKYFTGFSKQIHDIPFFYEHVNSRYVEELHPALSFKEFLAYQIVYSSSNRFGIGLGYNLNIYKRFFLKFTAGYFLNESIELPKEIIYFPDQKKLFFYLNRNYNLEDFYFHSQAIKSKLKRNDNVNFYNYLLEISLGIRI